ncbi:cytochrome c [Nguyenibacter vanlangensis]|uniref:Cytochrome c n=1 Tax=Nguyenibacter vanlangensis TaxID=1216886 RepID=A0ABZ3D872_9PROT
MARRAPAPTAPITAPITARITAPMAAAMAAWLLLCPAGGRGADLTVTDGASVRRLPAAALLHRADLVRLDLSRTTVKLGAGVAAIPLSHVAPCGGQALIFTARDRFVAGVPCAALRAARRRGVTAWIAIAEGPWPGNSLADLGPFALVWTGADAAAIPREDWVEQLVAIGQGDPDPLPAAPAGTQAARGRALFAVDCLPCHRLDGIGRGTKGPDLGQPMNVTAYLTQAGFHALVRDPRAVRHWPAQAMAGFPPDLIGDDGIAALWAYLQLVAPRAAP